MVVTEAAAAHHSAARESCRPAQARRAGRVAESGSWECRPRDRLWLDDEGSDLNGSGDGGRIESASPSIVVCSG